MCVRACMRTCVRVRVCVCACVCACLCACLPMPLSLPALQEVHVGREVLQVEEVLRKPITEGSGPITVLLDGKEAICMIQKRQPRGFKLRYNGCEKVSACTAARPHAMQSSCQVCHCTPSHESSHLDACLRYCAPVSHPLHALTSAVIPVEDCTDHSTSARCSLWREHRAF